jgi:hypothetical protein
MAAIQKQHDSLGQIWLSDIHDKVLERCKLNVETSCNASADHPGVHILALDWMDALSTGHELEKMNTKRKQITPDVIIGADLVFDPSLILPLVATLKLFLNNEDEGKRAPYALIALTVRNEETFDTFTQFIRNSSLRLEDVEFSMTEPLFIALGSGTDSVRLLRILVDSEKGCT